MKGIILALTFVLAGSVFLSPNLAAAQFDETYSRRANIESPERFTLEFRIGPYHIMDTEPAFFDDSGPMLALEYDVLIYRLTNVGSIGVGGSIGWGVLSGNAFERGTQSRVDEESDLTLIPLSLFGVLRLDILPRLLDFPLIFAGKFGIDYVRWDATTGANSASGGSFGMRWAVQAGLELDFLDRAAARQLDEEWGINHSFLFFELYGSTADSTLDVGTDGLGWAAGLGLNL